MNSVNCDSNSSKVWIWLAVSEVAKGEEED